MSNYIDNAVSRNFEADREFAEYALSKAHLLGEQDQKIITLRYEAGMTYEDIAVRVGMARGGMCKRIHRIEDRLTSESFKLVAMNIKAFPPKYRPYVKAKYLQGLSGREISRKLQVPHHRIRTLDVAALAILEAMFNYSDQREGVEVVR